jgi:UDPglucose 6-dehydrogenase
MDSYSIAVIGIWHLGEIYSAGLASLGHTVVGISDDAMSVENLNKGIPPLPEPQLEELIKKNIAEGRLSYSTDYSSVAKCSVVWLTFDTPVDDNDEVDLSPIMKAVDAAIPYLQENALFVVSSQIPVGTSYEIMARIRAARPELSFEYAYTPENLQLGKAVQCFLDPARVIAGVSSASAADMMKNIFNALPNPAEIIAMAPASAEMGKHALNSYLSAQICFANDLSDIAERVGADMLDVTRMLKSDPRIGPRAYLDAGVSFSGGTLNRDIKILTNLARHYFIQPSVIESIYLKNEGRKEMIASKLEHDLGTLDGKTITLLGLTYKPGTKTLRRSYPLEVARGLVEKGATVRLHDPQADEAEIGIPDAVFSRDVYDAVLGADAVVLLTTWPQFKELDFARLSDEAKPGAIFFDTSNFLAAQEADIAAAGFKYKGVGRAKKR